MHIQIVNFRLKDMSDAEYRSLCDLEFAPAFAGVPGLLTKVWLADRDSGVYGGVYTWRDKQAMDEYMKSDLLTAVLNHPNLVDITSKDFEILEGPTRVTRGMASAVV